MKQIKSHDASDGNSHELSCDAHDTFSCESHDEKQSFLDDGNKSSDISQDDNEDLGPFKEIYNQFISFCSSQQPEEGLPSTGEGDFSVDDDDDLGPFKEFFG